MTACELALTATPNDGPLLKLKGRILLFENHLAESRQTLSNVPMDKETAELDAEIAVRENDFTTAAKMYSSADDEAKAAQYRSFGKKQPYRCDWSRPTSIVPFISTDPLPLVELTVNGKAANFIIDTGGSQIILDPEFAKTIGVTSVGQQSGVFGGGKTNQFGIGRADSIEAGGLTVHDVPVQLLSTSAFSAAANGRPVSGILGTVFLSHFQSTLDYPSGTLVLAPAVPSHDRRDGPIPSGTTTLPMWLAGDHYIVAEGSVGSGPTHLLLVDTGLAGAGFTGPLSTLTESGIKPPETNATGVGGGGSVAVGPFELSSLKLGPVEVTDLIGIYGAFPKKLEDGLGFHLAGIVSHQFFRNFVTTFDFRTMTITLRKVG